MAVKSSPIVLVHQALSFLPPVEENPSLPSRLSSLPAPSLELEGGVNPGILGIRHVNQAQSQ